ncbi:transcription antitermination factor NusB [Prochlorothrix hollandica]|uniref:transcription antitermination factor NusB n=1 Tax=Prochlorothrix hollandica TaxID=1223 RepID=UPI00333E36A9
MQRQPRRLARELALLVLGQTANRQANLTDESTLQSLLLATVRTLVMEAHDSLEAATTELTQGNEQLLNSNVQAPSLDSAKAMVQDAAALTQKAINQVGIALELPELIQMARQDDIRTFAITLCQEVHSQRSRLDAVLNQAMVDWQLSRLPRVDQDILRIAVAEILCLDIGHQVAINEAVELSKRYSDEEGRRLINGILRRVVQSLEAETLGEENTDPAAIADLS